jgi:hypothetical protein
MAVIKAKRLNTKVRILLTGSTNTGKTLTSLKLARGLIEAPNGLLDWSKIGLVDTERKRSLFYADSTKFDVGEFLVSPLDPPYSVERYKACIKELLEAGCEVIIIDSLSHAWAGTGGILEVTTDIANRANKNSYNAWGGSDGGTAKQNELIDYIMSLPVHVICTTRSKMDYVMEKDDSSGKTTIRKVGLKPVQRGDLEYEFDLTLQMENDHSATIIKNTLDFLTEDSPLLLAPIKAEELGNHLMSYLTNGVNSTEINKEILASNIETIKKKVSENPAVKELIKPMLKGKKLSEIDLQTSTQIIKQLQGF